MTGDFEPEQKRYLEGFVAGMQIARTAGGLVRTVGGGAAPPTSAPAAEPVGPDAAHLRALNAQARRREATALHAVVAVGDEAQRVAAGEPHQRAPAVGQQVPAARQTLEERAAQRVELLVHDVHLELLLVLLLEVRVAHHEEGRRDHLAPTGVEVGGCQEIAGQLFLSPNTVSTHRTRILRKMNMKSNAELMHYAIAHHLVD